MKFGIVALGVVLLFGCGALFVGVLTGFSERGGILPLQLILLLVYGGLAFGGFQLLRRRLTHD